MCWPKCWWNKGWAINTANSREWTPLIGQLSEKGTRASGKKHILIRSSHPLANEMHAQANVTYLTTAQTDIVKLTDRGSECGELTARPHICDLAFYLSASRTNSITTTGQQMLLVVSPSSQFDEAVLLTFGNIAVFWPFRFDPFLFLCHDHAEQSSCTAHN